MFGDTEIQRSAIKTRLLETRAYSSPHIFRNENLLKPPTLEDLYPPKCKNGDRYWTSLSFRAVIFVISYLSFPIITQVLDTFVSLEPEQQSRITANFAPGVSILYGTFVSLTLSILYNRQMTIQDNVAVESSLLAMLLRNMLSMFQMRGDEKVDVDVETRERVIEAGQCVADQVRTLVSGSRGEELMGLTYSDPYARLLELVEEKEVCLMKEHGDLGAQSAVIAHTRDILKDLFKIRCNRLSDEALALPPTHFFILTALTSLILLGYTASVLPTLDTNGHPSTESSVLFAFLCSIYVLFYNFTNDLNDPFDGVYQIRRSSTSSHLLQTKWFIANHELLRGEVDFDDGNDDFDECVC